jgi:hypothetical protein
MKALIYVCLMAMPLTAWGMNTNSSVALSEEHFALEDGYASRADLQVSASSDACVSGPVRANRPKRELKLDSFFESGPNGDRSIDLSQAVLRFETASDSYLWLGRAHPALEGTSHDTIEPSSAIGSRWVQNQSNALSPRVSGWLGAGWGGDVSGVSVTVGFSPLFLPSFGPRLDLSVSKSASGSRFARLPPQYLNSQREAVDIRYQVNAGDLKNIVLQNQLFVGIGRETSVGTFRLLGWSSPSPDPSLDISDVIRIRENDAKALVTVVPSFRRQTFGAFQWESDSKQFLAFEAVYEMTKGPLAASLAVRPTHTLRFGTLQTLATRASEETSGIASDRPYAENLIWAEVKDGFFKERLVPSLRFEYHYTPGHEDYWWHPALSWRAKGGLELFASANILAAEDGSYLSAWRSLDSVSTGIRYIW